MLNICINDIFLIGDNACLSSYANDTTFYSTGENHNTNRSILDKTFFIAVKIVFWELRGFKVR